MIRIEMALRRGPFSLEVGIRVPDRGVTALFGPSGAGKTTVASALAGLVTPDSGTITIGERVLFDAAKRVSLPPERRSTGYVFQQGRLFPHMSVRANLLYGRRRTRVPAPHPSLEHTIELLGIRPLLDRRPIHLSGGEVQRVAIGRALLSSPRILILDEPLASLDQRRKEEVLPCLEHLASDAGIPILYVTHSLDEIVRLADQLVVLEAGRLVASGPTAEVMASPDLPVLADRRDAGTIVRAVVAGHDAGYQLTELRFAGGVLSVPAMDRPVGAALVLRILARDVSLALERPDGISVQNVLPGTITRIYPRHDGNVDAIVDVGDTLCARVTRRAADHLGLCPGLRVHALVKAVSLARVPSPGRGAIAAS